MTKMIYMARPVRQSKGRGSLNSQRAALTQHRGLENAGYMGGVK